MDYNILEEYAGWDVFEQINFDDRLEIAASFGYSKAAITIIDYAMSRLTINDMFK